MKMNDPLQTLYQLMSGRQPAAVTVRQAPCYWTPLDHDSRDNRFDLTDMIFLPCVFCSLY